MAKDAPNAAELDIPNVNGEAKSLRIKLWAMTPEVESTAPVKTAAMTLGSLIFIITLCTALFLSVQKELIFCKLISNEPINIAMCIDKNNKMSKAKINHNLRLL